MPRLAEPLTRFVADVESALAAGPHAAVAALVKERLKRRIVEDALEIPEAATTCLPERYARRLLYRDSDGRFSVVAMAWGPGQRAALHDHDGSWCVEGVLAGAVVSEAWILKGEEEGGLRFVRGRTTLATVGDTAAIFPPFEHHVFGNAVEDVSAVTLHVYGPEILRCRTYVRGDGELYSKCERTLCYDPW